MCKCKIGECNTNRCGCFKHDIGCDKCQCEEGKCKNRRPKEEEEKKDNEPKTEQPVPKEEIEEQEESKDHEYIFKPQLRIGSWNLCHFTFFKDEQMRRRFCENIEIMLLMKLDLLVLQEMPKNLQLMITWLNETFKDCFIVIGEHVFIWNKETISKVKMLNLFGEMKTQFCRLPATIEFIWNSNVLCMSSVHLKQDDPQKEFKVIMEYFKTNSTLDNHLLIGDFNFNLLSHPNDWRRNWTCSQSRDMVTTVGGKAYDWLLVQNELLDERFKNVGYNIYPLIRSKNSRKSEKGISDHHLITFFLC